jgi:hypothetical protein
MPFSSFAPHCDQKRHGWLTKLSNHEELSRWNSSATQIFQQDNARQHTACLTMDYLQIRALLWFHGVKIANLKSNTLKNVTYQNAIWQWLSKCFCLFHWRNTAHVIYKRPLIQRQIQYLLWPPLTWKIVRTRLDIDSISRWILTCGILCYTYWSAC